MLMRPELMEELKPRFDQSMECYLSGFANDGICVEGCEYWGYGFGFFVTYADMLKTFTNGKTDYFAREKVRSIATYLQKMFLSETACVSFSDGGTHLRYHLGLMHYLKNLYPRDVVVYPRKYAYHYDGCARFCLHLRAALWYDERWDSADAPVEDVTYYAEDSQWLIRKTPTYGFAAKGGHNADSHNHNDVGSFIFARGGRQWLTDPGSGVYNRAYFKNETRYTYFHTSSLGHSVPIVGGEPQKAGKSYRAESCRLENGDFVMDLASAYGIDLLKSLERRFTCQEKTVTVTDTFDYRGDGDLVERLVCTVEPERTEAGILTVGACRVTYDAALVEDVRIEKRVTPGRADCYTVDLVLRDGVKFFSFTVE